MRFFVKNNNKIDVAPRNARPLVDRLGEGDFEYSTKW